MNERNTNKIYTKALNGEHVSSVDLASLIRLALKKEFPGTKFSVKTSKATFSSSITINWVDGPSTPSVDAFTDKFSTRGFDASIDLSYGKNLWIHPDGTVYPAGTQGTEGSGGYYAAEKFPAKSPDAILLKNVASTYVFCSRVYTEKLIEQARQSIQEKYANWSDFDGFKWDLLQIVPPTKYISAHVRYADSHPAQYEIFELVQKEARKISVETN